MEMVLQTRWIDSSSGRLTADLLGWERLHASYMGRQPEMSLSQPQVLACYFDIGLMPPIAAMLLEWPEEEKREECCWRFPNSERITSKPPCRFGVRIHRQADDAYAVALVWDTNYRQWFSLRRREIESSSLGQILAALGTQLDYLLDQPLEWKEQSRRHFQGAA